MVNINKDRGVSIQIKDNSTKKSKCFTIYGEELIVCFNRLLFLYECLEKNKEVVIIKNE